MRGEYFLLSWYIRTLTGCELVCLGQLRVKLFLE